MSISETLKRQYRDLQYIARAMVLEVSPGSKDDVDFEDRVNGIVESIMSYLYSKFTNREISNAITVLKMTMETIDEE